MRFILVLFALLVSTTPALAAKTILVMGDSLSAGYGIRPEQAWPSLLGTRLSDKRLDYSVANLSISGETTAGGRSRLTPALKTYQPAIVVIALGANDGLRGLPLAQMRDNLNAMVDAARSAGARVVLAGMRLPPNYGPYAADFHSSFVDIAKAKKAPLVDFLLEPVAANPRYFQPDNLHPLAEAQPLILDHVWPAIVPLLK
ncbi:arylesterase [Ferribacterium limneticum]|uniref:arylesterase n=1 Tax=Ferribacterium limneticum TaxID=76259 RepID=UPI001CFA0121|nr:arylesterase [Ferribacterium limneticum]UCV29928.1 arylesterase [Ferribacterium limneticum]UCV33847.1 arylesterase [Ferribacterium limneticum]